MTIYLYGRPSRKEKAVIFSASALTTREFMRSQ